jgi:hypothetical protein
MKLTFRGVSYDYLPHATPVPGPTYGQGTYRGTPITFQAMAELPAQPGADLAWRGVPYRNGIEAADTTPMAATPVEAIAPSAPKEKTQVTPIPVTVSTLTTEEVTPVSVSLPDEVSAPVLSVTDLARNLFIRRHQRSRRREQGMMVRLASEVGLSLEDAAHYESHIQGKMPHDFSGYDRSSTAMS